MQGTPELQKALEGARGPLDANSVTLATKADTEADTSDTIPEQPKLARQCNGEPWVYRPMPGQIANSFGALLHHFYPDDGPPHRIHSRPIARGYSAWGFGGGNSSSSYAPREFKRTFGRFTPAFSGYRQHDTLESLGLLLKGLHEYLDRMLKQP
ncbi:CSN-associated deubiquitinating enzyme Ubp12 [Ceratobasidium sp. 428]|nr:CSN-associated deubiquitinating enzyme Ubp12 [Ceratobasidium sp. 428]